MPKDILKVTVVSASGLLAKDKTGYEASSVGSSDPYCVLSVDQPWHHFETSVVKQNLHPKWNETFDFKLDSDSGLGKLEIYVWDKDPLGKKDFLGYLCIPLAKIRKKDRAPRSYKLNERSHGEIKLSLHLQVSLNRVDAKAWAKWFTVPLPGDLPLLGLPLFRTGASMGLCLSLTPVKGYFAANAFFFVFHPSGKHEQTLILPGTKLKAIRKYHGTNPSHADETLGVDGLELITVGDETYTFAGLLPLKRLISKLLEISADATDPPPDVAILGTPAPIHMSNKAKRLNAAARSGSREDLLESSPLKPVQKKEVPTPYTGQGQVTLDVRMPGRKHEEFPLQFDLLETVAAVCGRLQGHALLKNAVWFLELRQGSVRVHLHPLKTMAWYGIRPTHTLRVVLAAPWSSLDEKFGFSKSADPELLFTLVAYCARQPLGPMKPLSRDHFLVALGAALLIDSEVRASILQRVERVVNEYAQLGLLWEIRFRRAAVGWSSFYGPTAFASETEYERWRQSEEKGLEDLTRSAVLDGSVGLLRVRLLGSHGQDEKTRHLVCTLDYGSQHHRSSRFKKAQAWDEVFFLEATPSSTQLKVTLLESSKLGEAQLASGVYDFAALYQPPPAHPALVPPIAEPTTITVDWPLSSGIIVKMELSLAYEYAEYLSPPNPLPTKPVGANHPQLLNQLIHLFIIPPRRQDIMTSLESLSSESELDVEGEKTLEELNLLQAQYTLRYRIGPLYQAVCTLVNLEQNLSTSPTVLSRVLASLTTIRETLLQGVPVDRHSLRLFEQTVPNLKAAALGFLSKYRRIWPRNHPSGQLKRLVRIIWFVLSEPTLDGPLPDPQNDLLENTDDEDGLQNEVHQEFYKVLEEGNRANVQAEYALLKLDLRAEALDIDNLTKLVLRVEQAVQDTDQLFRPEFPPSFDVLHNSIVTFWSLLVRDIEIFVERVADSKVDPNIFVLQGRLGDFYEAMTHLTAKSLPPFDLHTLWKPFLFQWLKETNLKMIAWTEKAVEIDPLKPVDAKKGLLYSVSVMDVFRGLGQALASFTSFRNPDPFLVVAFAECLTKPVERYFELMLKRAQGSPLTELCLLQNNFHEAQNRLSEMMIDLAGLMKPLLGNDRSKAEAMQESLDSLGRALLHIIKSSLTDLTRMSVSTLNAAVSEQIRGGFSKQATTKVVNIYDAYLGETHELLNEQSFKAQLQLLWNSCLALVKEAVTMLPRDEKLEADLGQFMFDLIEFFHAEGEGLDAHALESADPLTSQLSAQSVYLLMAEYDEDSQVLANAYFEAVEKSTEEAAEHVRQLVMIFKARSKDPTAQALLADRPECITDARRLLRTDLQLPLRELILFETPKIEYKNQLGTLVFTNSYLNWLPVDTSHERLRIPLRGIDDVKTETVKIFFKSMTVMTDDKQPHRFFKLEKQEDVMGLLAELIKFAKGGAWDRQLPERSNASRRFLELRDSVSAVAKGAVAAARQTTRQLRRTDSDGSDRPATNPSTPGPSPSPSPVPATGTPLERSLASPSPTPDSDLDKAAAVAVSELIKRLESILTSIKIPPVKVAADGVSFQLENLRVAELACPEDRVKVAQAEAGRQLQINGASLRFEEFDWSYEKKVLSSSVKDAGRALASLTGISIQVLLDGPKPKKSPDNRVTIAKLELQTLGGKGLHTLILQAGLPTTSFCGQ